MNELELELAMELELADPKLVITMQIILVIMAKS